MDGQTDGRTDTRVKQYTPLSLEWGIPVIISTKTNKISTNYVRWARELISKHAARI